MPAHHAPLCLACGMCCDGTLFKDVELQPGDNAARLSTLGLPVRHLQRKTCFAQPCAALGADCRCAIYAQRPARCRQFDCVQLTALANGTTTPAAALRTVQRARRLAQKVRRLLRSLGDHDEQRALRLRFQRVQRRFEKGGSTVEASAVFAELSLAMHRLNLILSRSFYPAGLIDSAHPQS